MQRLPDTALLLASPDGRSTGVQPVECHRAIITLPHATTAPLAPADAQYPVTVVPPADAPEPELNSPGQQQNWPHDPPEEPRPSWPPHDPPAQWWTRNPRT